MSYTILLTNGTVLTTIPDGTINTTSTSLGLPGRNYAGYGQPIDENFVWLTENFANTAPPANPLAGQLWYNTNNQTLYVCPIQGTTSASSWLALTSTSSGGTTTFGNVTVNGNIQANNATVTNSISANAITVNFATVSSNLVAGNANITTANVGTLYTNAISSGSQSTAGTLTGVWTANGSGTVTYTGPHTASGTSLYVTGGNLVIDPGSSSAGIRSDNYYYANGTPIPIGGIYGNTQVASFLSTGFGSNTITTSGTITAGTLSATGTVVATNIGNIAAINLTGSSSNVLYGNGVFAPAAGGSTYGDSNVVTLLAAFGSNTIVTTGNITGGNFIGNGKALTGITSAGTAGAVSMTPQSTGTYYLPFISGTTSGNYALNGNANFSANLANGYITATGFVGNGAALTGVAASFPITNGTSNIAAPVVNGNINITAAGNTTLVITGTGANISGTLNATGNANVGNIGAVIGVFTNVKGEGGNLSNIQGSNVIGTVATAISAGTVTTAAQPGITSVGTLTSLTVSGAITTNGNAVGYLGIPQSGGAGKTTSYTTVLSDSGTQIYCTGGNAATATTCSSSSTTLTVGTPTGTFAPGMPILIASGTGTLATGTTYIVSQLSGTTGGAGTYQLSQAPTVALASATIYGGPVLTIAANSSVAYPVGTVLTFINDGSVANLQAGITCADNLVWQASGATGTRFLNRYGIAVATKVTGTRWFITGALT